MIFVTIVSTVLIAVMAMVSAIKMLDMNSLYVFGSLYVIKRDIGHKGIPFMSTAFMRGTQAPWYVGHGIQFRIRKNTLQIGVCKKTHHDSEDDGVLGAMGGRYLDEPAEKIGNW